MSGIELVIARHEEDLAWTKNVVPGIRTTVYDKGNISDPSAIALPNLGREAHSYLHHIVSRYDLLTPVTVFCQGHPFDHCSNFHAVLRQLADADAHLLPPFRWLGFIIDWDDSQGQRLFRNWSKNENQESLELELFCKGVLPENADEPFIFFPGAQFIVTRDLILSRPKNFYENALEVAERFPNAAHCFERTWDRVFGTNGIPPEHREKELPVYLKPIRRLM